MKFYEELESSAKYFLAWFLPALLGVATKLAYESRLKKISSSRIITSLIMACFVGYMCDKMCTRYGLSDFRGIIVSIGALASESIIQYILTNMPRFLTATAKRIFNIDLTSTPANNEQDVTS